jgi:hypothetical protein
MNRTTTARSRSKHLLLRIAGVVAALTGLLVLSITPAGAAGQSSPALSMNASTATTVGFQIWTHVNLSNGSSPTGTITFKLFGPADSSCSSAMFTSSVAVTGTSINSDAFTTSVAGTYRWQATYSGDANNQSYGPTACTASAAAVDVSRSNAPMAVTAQAESGGTIRAAASIGGFQPTGSITFLLSPPGDDFCSATPVFSTTTPLSGKGTYNSAAYTPTATGTYRWRATYSGDADNIQNGPTACLDQGASVSVNTVTAPAAAITVSPASVSFAAQVVGTTSPAQKITVTNTGNGGLAIGSITVAGTNASDFPTSGDTCSGATVAPGATCSIAADFAPRAAGSRSAALAIADNTASSPQGVSLTGQATAKVLANPQLTATASASVHTGGSVWATAAVANGNAPTGSIIVSLYTNGSCSGSPLFTSTKAITGNGSYRSDSFTAANTGSYRFVASYSGDANNNPAASACSDPADTVTVTSPPPPPTTTPPTTTPPTTTPPTTTPPTTTPPTTTPPTTTPPTTPPTTTPPTTTPPTTTPPITTPPRVPSAAVNPGGVAFADTAIGATSAAKTITVTNSGSAALVVSSVRATGANGPEFLLSTDGCSGTTVAPAATCHVAVAFAPQGTGNRTANLSLTDNAAASPQVVTLSGVGTNNKATFLTPTNGQSNVATTKPFSWTTVAGAQGYYLAVGTTQYGTDLVDSKALPASQSSFNVPELPTGRTLYATVLTEVNGSWSRFQAVTFTAAPGHATFTAPVNGQRNVATTAALTWAPVAGAQGYYVAVGTSKYGTNVVNSGALSPTQTSYQGKALPKGTILYATVLTEVNGSWARYQTITFTTA